MIIPRRCFRTNSAGCPADEYSCTTIPSEKVKAGDQQLGRGQSQRSLSCSRSNLWGAIDRTGEVLCWRNRGMGHGLGRIGGCCCSPQRSWEACQPANDRVHQIYLGCPTIGAAWNESLVGTLSTPKEPKPKYAPTAQCRS